MLLTAEPSFPRTRGDEPRPKPPSQAVYGVFPAHAGMSPGPPLLLRDRRCFPRTRGDEPWAALVAVVLGAFSPHTRG